MSDERLEQPISSADSAAAISKADLADLPTWLLDRGIPVELWGRGAAKTVGELHGELVGGDCELLNWATPDGPRVERRVRVVQLEIRRRFEDGSEKVLVETEQVLGDGRRRPRELLPSEKMHPEEDAVGGAVRCLQEELGVEPEEARIDGDNVTETETTAESPSYPGLLTRYRFYRVPLSCDALPSHDWISEEEGDAVTAHHWQWKAQAPSP